MNAPTPEINMLEKGAPLPASIGRCADFYKAVQTLRLQMEKEAEAVKARETEIKEHIIATLSKSQDTGAAGLKFRAQIVMKDVVRVATTDASGEPFDGWGSLFSWIRKHDRFDMLQKRLADKAVKDWMGENGRALPGTEVIHIPDVSITKI